MAGGYRLPVIIAGPMIRRASAEAVHFWFITTEAIPNPRVRLFDSAPFPVEVTTENTEPLQIGEKLWLYLLRAVPGETFLPHAEVLFYDIGFLQNADEEDTFLSLLGEIADQIIHPDHDLPSFILQAGGENDLRALYGSCRKLHGPGIDLMTQAEARLRDTMEDLDQRPHVIVLGGDQIYADDVSDKLIGEANRLGRHLIGSQNASNLVHRYVLDRQDRLARWGFTSTHMHNHLESLGEFFCLYLLAWNGDLWDQITLKVTARPNPEERGRDGAYAARFVFANCVSYMMFDDHEVTDDWNFDPKWEKYVYRLKSHVDADSKSVKGGGPLADIIVNALVSFWVFQAYGNNPDDYTEDFKALVGDFCLKDRNRPALRKRILGFHNWTFAAPTSPPIVFIDTRTRRAHDPVLGERIIDQPGLKQLHGLMRDALDGSLLRPLILVLATPLFDIMAKENSQAAAKAARNAGRGGSGLHPNFDAATEHDAESFGVFEQSVLDLLAMVARFRVQPLVILCGDVHYAYEQSFSFTFNKRVSIGVQLCSSSLKNQPLGSDLNLVDAAEAAPLGATRVNPRSHASGSEFKAPPPQYYGILKSTNRVQVSGSLLDYSVFVEVRRSINSSDEYGRYLANNNLGEVQINTNRVRNRFHYEEGARIKTSPYYDWDVSNWPVLPGHLRP
ncbi:MAG: hypothetical protein VYA55_17080 [Pseudomonadota bacterium]|nr:hypothetical protein [Pseudomonadota bacterium]